MTDKTFYITTPIYYVNDVPHLGHAYTTTACDVMARFKRLDGYDVKFLTGTDEHGLKVAQSAEKKGVSPQQFTDKVSQSFCNLTDSMNFSNDDFIRTTEERHKIAAQALWKKLEENGYIYLDKYAGWYAVRDEAYYAEDELHDGPDGVKFAPSGAECTWVEEESYFFKLSAFEDKLIDLYESQPDFIQPNSRRNEVMSFVKSGLRDLSISRTTFDWGIPVPGNDKHVMYVWIDALTNYITALGYPNMKKGSDFEKYWPNSIHVIGKDILRFHAVYWPAFLMAADLMPPKKIFANGWWTIEGQKMSKSIGNVIAPDDLIERYGLDQTRYFIMREVPFGNDGDFSNDAAITRINADLSNGLGNLVQRTLTMITKNCDSCVPACGALTQEDKQLLALAHVQMPAVARELVDELKFNRMLENIWTVVSAANSYIDHQAPWKLRKEDPDRMKTVLYVLAETIRCLGLILQPVMPQSCEKILDLLNVEADKRMISHIGEGEGDALESGHSLNAPAPIFPRIVVPENEAA